MTLEAYRCANSVILLQLVVSFSRQCIKIELTQIKLLVIWFHSISFTGQEPTLIPSPAKYLIYSLIDIQRNTVSQEIRRNE